MNFNKSAFLCLVVVLSHSLHSVFANDYGDENQFLAKEFLTVGYGPDHSEEKAILAYHQTPRGELLIQVQGTDPTAVEMANKYSVDPVKLYLEWTGEKEIPTILLEAVEKARELEEKAERDDGPDPQDRLPPQQDDEKEGDNEGSEVGIFNHDGHGRRLLESFFWFEQNFCQHPYKFWLYGSHSSCRCMSSRSGYYFSHQASDDIRTTTYGRSGTVRHSAWIWARGICGANLCDHYDWWHTSSAWVGPGYYNSWIWKGPWGYRGAQVDYAGGDVYDHSRYAVWEWEYAPLDCTACYLCGNDP